MGVHVDLETLEAFDRMAVDGAASATNRLTGLTGIATGVDASRLGVVSATELREEFESDATVTVSISLEGSLAGDAVLVFDRENARRLAEAFMPALPSADGYTAKHEDAVTELCSVMVSGYIDGWAEQRADPVEMSPPVVVSSPITDGRHDAPSVVAAGRDGASDYVVTQRSSIATRDGTDGEPVASLYQFLDAPSTMALLGSDDPETEPIAPFRDVVDAGVDRLLDRARTMAAGTVDPTTSAFEIVPAERLSETVPDDEYAGVVIELTGTPKGYVLALTDRASTQRVANAFTPEPSTPAFERAPSSDAEALTGTVATELGRALVGGLEDRLDAPVEASAPQFVADMASSIVNDAVINASSTERFVCSFETRVDAADGDLEWIVYTLIRPSDLPERRCD